MDGITKLPGFTKKPGLKPIEYLVQAYLRLITSGKRLREERKFLEKAIAIINQILGHPCCDDPEAVVNLITPYENQITTSLKNVLLGGAIVRRSFRHSLFRMLNLLNKYLYDCCTEVLTVNFTSAVPTDVTVNFSDLVTGDLLFSTTTIGGTTQSITLPAKYFGPGALIKVCINVINAPTFPNTDSISSTSTGVLVSSSTVGETCSNIFTSLQSSYTVTQA